MIASNKLTIYAILFYCLLKKKESVCISSPLYRKAFNTLLCNIRDQRECFKASLAITLFYNPRKQDC